MQRTQKKREDDFPLFLYSINSFPVGISKDRQTEQIDRIDVMIGKRIWVNVLHGDNKLGYVKNMIEHIMQNMDAKLL